MCSVHWNWEYKFKFCEISKSKKDGNLSKKVIIILRLKHLLIFKNSQAVASTN